MSTLRKKITFEPHLNKWRAELAAHLAHGRISEAWRALIMMGCLDRDDQPNAVVDAVARQQRAWNAAIQLTISCYPGRLKSLRRHSLRALRLHADLARNLPGVVMNDTTTYPTSAQAWRFVPQSVSASHTLWLHTYMLGGKPPQARRPATPAKPHVRAKKTSALVRRHWTCSKCGDRCTVFSGIGMPYDENRCPDPKMPGGYGYCTYEELVHVSAVLSVLEDQAAALHPGGTKAAIAAIIELSANKLPSRSQHAPR